MDTADQAETSPNKDSPKRRKQRLVLSCGGEVPVNLQKHRVDWTSANQSVDVSNSNATKAVREIWVLRTHLTVKQIHVPAVYDVATSTIVQGSKADPDMSKSDDVRPVVLLSSPPEEAETVLFRTGSRLLSVCYRRMVYQRRQGGTQKLLCRPMTSGPSDRD